MHPEKYGQAMKRLTFVLMMMLAAATAVAKEDWKGKIVDEKGEPVA